MQLTPVTERVASARHPWRWEVWTAAGRVVRVGRSRWSLGATIKAHLWTWWYDREARQTGIDPYAPKEIP